MGEAIVSLAGVTKVFDRPGGAVTVAENVTLALPPGVPVALLGRNGAGKSTLLRLIAGTLRPDTGEVRRFGRVSWPVGFAGSFHPDLTGRQNLRFAARLYGADARVVIDTVEDFAELGRGLDTPLRAYSSGMRARLAFGLSMALPFDLYLIDEVTAVGDAAFRERSEAVLRDRLRSAGAVVVSHALKQVASLCDAGMVLDRGQITWHDDIKEAIAHHRALMEVA